MPYYAGAGVLFIILVILGASQAKYQRLEKINKNKIEKNVN